MTGRVARTRLRLAEKRGKMPARRVHQSCFMDQADAIFKFGPYELRPRARELHKNGVKVRLRPQPFQVLQMLLEHSGKVVTREELRGKLWPSDTFVDFEHGLNTAVKELRAALSDSVAEPRYIQTLPRVGYRMIIPVSAEKPTQAPDVALSRGAVEERVVSETVSRFRVLLVAVLRHRRVVAGVAIILIVGLGVYARWSYLRARPAPVKERSMLAVLPFENMTGDASQEYFSDGLTEEMIGQLGQLDPKHLGVIARTSVMRYKRTQEPLQQIGGELGVQYVLEGSVRRESNRVRISAQLIQMKDQTHLWSRQYDRELSGLLALQGEIAREAANEIQLALGDDGKRIAAARKPTTAPSSYEAYDLYLKGRYFWNKRSREGLQLAAESFQEAIAKDPNYAPAYAGLADTYALMGSYSLAPPREIMPKARAATLKALELDANLAEAHTSLALIDHSYDWDWQTAEKEFRRAIELNPNYSTAHHWYAEYLAFQGRFDEAFAEMQQARQLDPLSLIIAADNGTILYFSRQYDRAIEQLRTVRAMEPGFSPAHIVLGAYVQKGQFAEALADIANWRRYADSPWPWAWEAYVYGRSGQAAQALHALANFEEVNRRWKMEPAAMLAQVYVGMGKEDEAFACLQKVLSEHSTAVNTLKVDPIYDPLRNDPRFQDLLRRVGLAQ